MSSPAELPVGVFDSGVGGISVLGEMLRVLPGERYIYFGDTANAPYGSKGTEEIRALSLKAAGVLLKRGIKCLVVACNTATSAAIPLLRATVPVPVVGMEPAVKPAVEMGRRGVVLVMATPLTLREDKFRSLVGRFSASAEIEPLSCPELVELIESGATEGDAIYSYLRDRLCPLTRRQVAAVVLGCTHFAFVKRQISSVIGEGTPVVDGNAGTARHLKTVLQQNRLVSTSCGEAEHTETAHPSASAMDRVTWCTSGNPCGFEALSLSLLRKVYVEHS